MAVLGSPTIRLSGSPASRGRGLKHGPDFPGRNGRRVARFARAWIETQGWLYRAVVTVVARFARAWIETGSGQAPDRHQLVARFARAWIETGGTNIPGRGSDRRPLRAGVD